MADEDFTKQVQTTFSLYGLTITKSLSEYVARQIIKGKPENEREECLTGVIEQLLNQNLQTPNIDKEHIILAFNEYAGPKTALKETETVLNVINAFDIPKIKYDLERKRFMVHNVDKELFPEAKYKLQVFKDRFDLLFYRTLRHDLFKTSRFGQSDEGKLELVPIEYLLSEAKTKDVYVMGLLTQLTEEQYYLEDSNGAVKIDLTNANYQSSLIMEGCVVIASGSYIDNVFKVEKIGFPPAEPSSNSRAMFGNINTFGGPHPTSLKASEKLAKHEKDQRDMLIIISEFWVDNLDVLDKFNELLAGFATSPPIAFIICGHFLSFPPNVTSMKKLKDGFESLALIIKQYPAICKQSTFIFVPGPFDLTAPKILPRVSLPRSIIKKFKQYVPSAIFATNPCRIQYCTKEIVVFREDVLAKFCRNAIQFHDTGEIYEHFAKSIICQSHLIPMTLETMPIYWKFDHALQLFPTPDLIVAADSYASYTTEFSECQVINPGSFSRSGYCFHAYHPSESMKDRIQDCELKD